MKDQTDCIMLVRNGGLPESDEDFEEMDKTEKRVVRQFTQFVDNLLFKQQRILWFFADPNDKPLNGVPLTEFFRIDPNPLPALIYVSPKSKTVQFF